MTRTILYAELPNFYASIERADHPELVDRPVIVGGDPRKRGLVQSASADAQVRAIAWLGLTGDTASALARLGASGSDNMLDLVLQAPVPVVVSTSPQPDDTDVPRSASIVVEFSRALDPASVDEASVALSQDGDEVAVRRRLSLDGRRLWMTPEEPLVDTEDKE